MSEPNTQSDLTPVPLLIPCPLSSTLTSGPLSAFQRGPNGRAYSPSFSLSRPRILTQYGHVRPMNRWLCSGAMNGRERQRVNRAERREKGSLCASESCSDEINGRNGLVQMEDRGGQGELGRKMKTITALHPTGASGRRSEVALLGRDSYPKPCWPLNPERWYQPLLLQTSSLITPYIPSLAFTFFLYVKLSRSL